MSLVLIALDHVLVVILTANLTLIEGLRTVTGSLPFAKIVTELGLFTTSYLVQRHVVFARRRDRTTAAPKRTSPAVGCSSDDGADRPTTWAT